MDADWLTALLEFSQQSPIGAVGAKLHHSDGSLKHIGILLGVNGVAAPAFHRHPRSSMGYWGTAIAARNYSAVSGECLMTRRAVYDEVGGFDDEMGGFADVDYCLRVTAAGYRVVFTPHAPLVHDDSSSRSAGADARDASRLRERWSDRLASRPVLQFQSQSRLPGLRTGSLRPRGCRPRPLERTPNGRLKSGIAKECSRRLGEERCT